MSSEIYDLRKCGETIEKIINSINHKIGINERTTLLTAKLWNAVEQIREVRHELEE